MLRTLSVWFGCCLISVVAAQDPGAKKDEAPKAAKPEAAAGAADPTEILKKADDACKAIKSKTVKYTAKGQGIGATEARTPKAEGSVILSGYKNGRPEKWRYEIKAQKAGSAETTEVTAGTDGNEFYVIDTARKIAYVDIDPAVLGSYGRLVQGITMLEYIHETPFTDEINGEKKELKGSTKIGDEDCYEVYVKYAQQGQEANWFFSKKDFLPRRVDRKFPGRDGAEPGGSQLTVTSLTVDPKFEKDPFKFVLPEGFTKSEDFAP